ncbi:IS110 family transposase [Cupriavidus sp. 2MCAB6]|uniref:IS110 family transposase n=1 Tax=Cupriavidus sp. 2MCAB6 TaxID=3232981 RepID=UPI003F924D06
MEACGGAHYWARRFMAMGHQVQMIAPKFVKPFVKSLKNDCNDAEAIVEAASRPTMRYVAINGIEQQDVQCMHRIRSLPMRDRIAQINQIRGLLAEYGIVIAQSSLQIQRHLPEIVADTTTELTELTKGTLCDMYGRLKQLDEQIARYDNKIRQIRQRGVGPCMSLQPTLCRA